THIQVLPDKVTTAPARRDNITTAPARRIRSIAAHAKRVSAVALSTDGRWLLTGGADPSPRASSHAGRLWELCGGVEAPELCRFASGVQAVAFSPDGRLAAACGLTRSEWSADCAGLVLVWDVESGRELRRYDARGLVLALAFTPDGQRLLIAGSDYLRVWDLETAQLLALISLTLGGEVFVSLAVSPDGRQALCGCRSSGGTRLIDLGRGECVRDFPGSCGWLFFLRPVAFSPDGHRVLTGSQDQ